MQKYLGLSYLGTGFSAWRGDLLWSTHGHDVARVGRELAGNIRENCDSKFLCADNIDCAGRVVLVGIASTRIHRAAEMVACRKHSNNRTGMGHRVQ